MSEAGEEASVCFCSFSPGWQGATDARIALSPKRGAMAPNRKTTS
jgi:hypothetical protein